MESTINWGDVATWFTGIITLGLFIIGFLQIRNERLARIKRENALEIHAKREQAEKISTWIINESKGKLLIAVFNQSQQPVYQVVVTVVAIGDTGNPRGRSSNHVCIAVAPPGQGYITTEADYHGMHRRPGVEIAFTDASGTNWVRKSNGELLEINNSTVEYYEIVIPTNWNTLELELPQK